MFTFTNSAFHEVMVLLGIIASGPLAAWITTRGGSKKVLSRLDRIERRQRGVVRQQRATARRLRVTQEAVDQHCRDHPARVRRRSRP